MYHIFVGFDERQKEAFQVCKHSIETRTNNKIKVHQLHHKNVRQSGLFTRTWTINEEGQYLDNRDGRPFSTQFTFTRFLVPQLWKNIQDNEKSSLVMFVDCDWLFLKDVEELFKELEAIKLRTRGKAPVYVVQHNYKPTQSTKMDNCQQHSYNMKLWAALMVFDMDHPDNENLTPELVNTAGGRDLMNFCWIKDVHKLGEINPAWHYVPNHSEKISKEAYGIHLTEGGPWFAHMRNGRFDNLWWEEYNNYLGAKVNSFKFNAADIIDSK